MIGSALRRTGASGFNPGALTWHTAFWADDPNWSNPGDGNAVSSWRDYSGNSRTATQGTGANQPIFRSSYASLNGRGAVDYTSSGQWLSTPTFTLAQPFTMLAIARTTSTAAARWLMADTDGSLALELNRFTTPTMYAGAFVNSTVTMDTSAHMVYGYFAGASSFIVCDATKTTGSAGTNTFSATYLSLAYRLGNSLLGGLAFAGLYSGNIESDPNWATFKAGVASYYGVTVP